MLDKIRSSAESWFIKIAFGVIIIVFVLGFGYSALRNNNQGSSAGVIAYVNEHPISVDDFMARARVTYVGTRLDELRADGRTVQLLQDMLREELLLEEADRLGITVSDREVRKEILLLTMFQGLDNVFSQDIYERSLAQVGVSKAYFENLIKKQLIRDKMSRYLTLGAQVDEQEARDYFDFYMEQATVDYLGVDKSDFMNATEAGEEDIAAYYEANPDQFRVADRIRVSYLLFTPAELASLAEVSQEEIAAYYEARKDSEYMQQERVKAKHILIPAAEDADEATVEQTSLQARSIHDRLQQGEAFDDIFAEYEANATLGLAQDLGWFPRGQMAAEFEQAAFSVPPGTYSEPIRTSFGWHVILVEEYEPAHPTPLEDLSDQIRDIIATSKGAAMLNDLLDTAIVQVYAGDSLETIARNLGLALRQSELFTQGDNLPDVVVDEDALPDLFALDADATTDWPVPVKDGFILADVLEKLPAQLLPLEEVRESITQTILDAKALEMAQARAEELLAQIQESGLPEELESQVATSFPFFRRPDLNFGLSVPQEIITDAFAAEPGQWLPHPYADNLGFVLARLKERTLPTDEEWVQSRDDVMASLLEVERNFLFSSYLQDIYEAAAIETVDEAEMYWKPDEDTDAGSL